MADATEGNITSLLSPCGGKGACLFHKGPSMDGSLECQALFFTRNKISPRTTRMSRKLGPCEGRFGLPKTPVSPSADHRVGAGEAKLRSSMIGLSSSVGSDTVAVSTYQLTLGNFCQKLFRIRTIVIDHFTNGLIFKKFR